MEEESCEELTLENLPQEMLFEIFSHLGVKERRLGIGSTCSYFSDLCDSFLPKKQKFVIKACDFTDKQEGYERIHEFVTNRSISCMNLELHYLQPSKINLDTWIETGWKIHSLLLSRCELDDFITKCLFQCCPNLNELRIINCAQQNMCFVERTINELLEEGIRYNNIETFQYTTYTYLSQGFYENVFKLFPNLRSISGGMDSTARRMNFLGIEPDFTRIDTCLSTSVKKLTFYVPSDCSWMGNLSNDHRLTELETIYRHSDESSDTFFHFLENQKQLERLHLYVHVAPAKRIDFYHRLFNCLKRSTSLKHLKLLGRSTDAYEDDSQFVRQVINKELSRLKNRILDSLKVDILRTSKKSYLTFHYKDLKSLDIRIRKTAHLQHIFQTHVNLKKLVFHELYSYQMDDFKSFGIRGPNNESSICRLTQLEHLGINGALKDINLLKELKLPKLKILDWPGTLFANLFLPETEHTKRAGQILNDVGVESFLFMMAIRRFRQHFKLIFSDYDNAKEIFYFKNQREEEEHMRPEEAVTLAQLTKNCPELEYINAGNCTVRINRFYRKFDLFHIKPENPPILI